MSEVVENLARDEVTSDIAVTLLGFVSKYGDRMYGGIHSILFVSKVSLARRKEGFFKTNSRWYWLGYKDGNKEIMELRRGSAAGRLIMTFTEECTVAEIADIFKGL